MIKLHIGDPVIVRDPFLLQLNRRSGKIHNKGWVHELCDDGIVMVEFPIRSDNPNRHSQISPYPKQYVLLDPIGYQRKVRNDGNCESCD